MVEGGRGASSFVVGELDCGAAMECSNTSLSTLHSLPNITGNSIASPVALLPGGRTGSCLLCTGDRTAGCILGSVGLFCKGCLVCVTGQGGKDGTTYGSVQHKGGRW